MLFAIIRKAVRDESEHCSRSIGIVFAIARNTHTTIQETSRSDPSSTNLVDEVTTSRYAPDPESQGKAVVFFMGSLKNDDGSWGRKAYKDKLFGILTILEYLEKINNEHWQSKEKKQAIEKFIKESLQILRDSGKLLERLRQEEREWYQKKVNSYKKEVK
jgi:PAB1-binding protein PBP1